VEVSLKTTMISSSNLMLNRINKMREVKQCCLTISGH